MGASEGFNLNPIHITNGAVSPDKLVALLLDQDWHRNCEITDGYSYPDSSDPSPKVLVRYPSKNLFLRYSQGPKQCYFWDVYGEDMHSVELAIFALSKAPAPPRDS